MPSKNEHYYSSVPDELDGDCPEAALTEKTASFIPQQTTVGLNGRNPPKNQQIYFKSKYLN